MSRAKYLKYLENMVEAMKKTTNDLTRENYELRQLLIHATASTKRKTTESIQG